MEATERNQGGVTSYTVDNKSNDNFTVSTYAYNLKDKTANAIIYVACYDKENKLIEIKAQPISIPAKTIDGIYELILPHQKQI